MASFRTQIVSMISNRPKHNPLVQSGLQNKILRSIDGAIQVKSNVDPPLNLLVGSRQSCTPLPLDDPYFHNQYIDINTLL